MHHLPCSLARLGSAGLTSVPGCLPGGPASSQRARTLQVARRAFQATSPVQFKFQENSPNKLRGAGGPFGLPLCGPRASRQYEFITLGRKRQTTSTSTDDDDDDDNYNELVNPSEMREERKRKRRAQKPYKIACNGNSKAKVRLPFT